MGKYFFSFANALIRNPVFVMSDETEVEIHVMWVSDLKMMPIVLGAGCPSCKHFCPLCQCTRDDLRHGPVHGATIRTYGKNEAMQQDEPLLDVRPVDVVVPPLHTLCGAVNTALKKMVDQGWRSKLFSMAKVKPSWRSGDLLDGRSSGKFLHFVARNPDVHVEYRDVFLALRKVENWASAGVFDMDAGSVNTLLEHLQEFATAWREAGLPTTNKFHLVESHVHDFAETYRSWGESKM